MESILPPAAGFFLKVYDPGTSKTTGESDDSAEFTISNSLFMSSDSNYTT